MLLSLKGADLCLLALSFYSEMQMFTDFILFLSAGITGIKHLVLSCKPAARAALQRKCSILSGSSGTSGPF